MSLAFPPVGVKAMDRLSEEVLGRAGGPLRGLRRRGDPGVAPGLRALRRLPGHVAAGGARRTEPSDRRPFERGGSLRVLIFELGRWAEGWVRQGDQALSQAKMVGEHEAFLGPRLVRRCNSTHDHRSFFSQHASFLLC